MSGFKKLKKSDVVVTPYVANKHWSFLYDTYTNHNDGISILKGTRVTGAFDFDNDPITENQYERLVYNSVNNLFYPTFYTESYSGSIPNFYTGSLTHNQTSPFYYKYSENPNFVSSFPTGSNAGIRVLSISKNIHSQAVHAGTFLLTSSAYSITDDANGNLYDNLSGSQFVGNIFYEQGLAVITNQNYQNIFPLPPLAGTSTGFFTSSASPKKINLLPHALARTGNLDTSSIQLVSGRTDLYMVNGDGTITLNTTQPGKYKVDYTINEIFGNTTLVSNIGHVYGTVIQDLIAVTGFYTNPVITDENSIVGNKGANTWIYPSKTIIFPIYFTSSTTSSLNIRVAFTDSTGVQDRYNSPYKTISAGAFDYIKIDFYQINYRFFDTYYVEYQDKDNNWRLLSSGTNPSPLNSAGFFGTLIGIGTPPTLNAGFISPYLTSYITGETGSASWKVSELNSGSIVVSSASGQFAVVAAATASQGTISLDGQQITSSIITYGGYTSSYANDFYYTNDFHIISPTSSINLDFGNILQTIYGAGNTYLGYRFYTYNPPVTQSASYIWVENTYTCAQDSVFTVGSTFTNFSSPSYLMYDSTSSMMFVMDNDDPNGNFYKFNPSTFVGTASISYISGSQDRIYAAAADYQYRRLYAVGRNSGGVKVIDTSTGTSITTISGGYDDSSHAGHNGFNRLGISILSSKIVTFDIYSNVLTTLDRPSLAILSNVSSSAITNGTAFIGGSSYFTEVLGNLWITPNTIATGSTANVGIYDTSLNYLTAIDLTTIGLPYHSILWDNAAYWRSVFYDQPNGKFYVYDYGSNFLVVIDAGTQSVIYSRKVTNLQNKTNSALNFIQDPITGDLFLSGRHLNNAGDVNFSKITYQINRSTYLFTQVLPGTEFTKLENVVGTNVLYGSSPGVNVWNVPNTGYNTDGIITTYTR